MTSLNMIRYAMSRVMKRGRGILIVMGWVLLLFSVVLFIAVEIGLYPNTTTQLVYVDTLKGASIGLFGVGVTLLVFAWVLPTKWPAA